MKNINKTNTYKLHSEGYNAGQIRQLCHRALTEKSWPVGFCSTENCCCVCLACLQIKDFDLPVKFLLKKEWHESLTSMRENCGGVWARRRSSADSIHSRNSSLSAVTSAWRSTAVWQLLRRSRTLSTSEW